MRGWRSSRARGRLAGMDTHDGHDLPLLALDHVWWQRPDWESLLGDGVEPAMILGAERRLNGERREVA